MYLEKSVKYKLPQVLKVFYVSKTAKASQNGPDKILVPGRVGSYKIYLHH